VSNNNKRRDREHGSIEERRVFSVM